MGRNYFWFEGKGRKPCSRLSLGLFIFVFFFSPFNLCVLVRCILNFLKCVFPQSFPLTLISAIDIPFSLDIPLTSTPLSTFTHFLAALLTHYPHVPPSLSFLVHVAYLVSSAMCLACYQRLRIRFQRPSAEQLRFILDCLLTVSQQYQSDTQSSLVTNSGGEREYGMAAQKTQTRLICLTVRAERDGKDTGG